MVYAPNIKSPFIDNNLGVEQLFQVNKSYAKWRTTRRKQIEAGKDIYCLGKRATKPG
jgi:hypothetical protein